MCSSRRNAFILYGILLIVSLAIVTISKDIGNYASQQLLTLAIIVGIITFLIIIPCSCPSKLSPPTIAEDNDSPNNVNIQQIQLHPSSNDTVPQSESLIIEASNSNPPRSRLYYLDNLKSILTILVVIHHVTTSFIGFGWYYMLAKYYNPFQVLFNTVLYINQTYFMCLFFFISAYFTPSSYDRKGVYKFMADKLKRLGIPYLVFMFILGPILIIFVVGIIYNSYSGYFPNPGPCWFLGWLLIFNTCYIMMDKTVPNYNMNCPSLIKISLIGIGVGLIQMIIASLGIGTFIFMPITFGSLPFDIIFFTAGIVAKRNDWLNQLVSMKVIIIRILTIFCFVVVIAVYVALYIADVGYVIPKSTESSTDCEGGDDWSNMPTVISSYFGAAFIFGGFCCMIFSLFMLQSASSFCNYTNGFLKFLSESAYTVYLIHPWIVVFITWTYSQLLVSFTGQKFFFCDDSTVSKTHFEHNYLVLLGWIYTICLSLIIVWPLSWCIRRIPGFNKVL